jgi:hypothetical protein
MRTTSGFTLLLSAFSAYFLTTDSYVSPVQSHRNIARRSTNLNELAVIRPNKCNINEYSASNRRFQLQCNGGDSLWSDQLLSKFRKPFVGLLAAVSFFVIGARNAVARPPKSSKAIGSAQKTIVIQNKKERQVSSKQPKKAVVVELVVKKNSISSSQLSRVGFVLVGVSTVATLLTGDDTKKKTKVVKKQAFKEPSRPVVTFDDEDEFDEPVQRVNRKINIAPGVEKPITSPKKVRKGLSPMTILPPQEDLFSQGEEDSFFEVTPEDLDAIKNEAPSTAAPSKKQNKFSLPPSASKMNKVPDRIGDDESFEVPDVRTTPVASIPAPPTPPPAKKGIFDRIFQKRSTSRPTDIAEVLRVQDTASSFRVAIATILTAYLPQGSGIFPDVEVGGVFSYPIDEDILFESEEKRISILTSLKNDLELQSKEAAEAFADVTNAMLVTLTDNCVDMLDKNGKISEDAEASVGVALDTLTDFAISAAGLFGQLLPGIIIEDGGIKYNGKAQRGKLETLFSCLMKGGMDLKALANMMKDDGEPDANSEVDMEKRSGRIQCLQHIFSISEGKRGSLEQKAMKDMIMTMVGSEGAGSDFAGMLGNMGGIGGMGGGPGASPEDAEKFNQMLKEEMKKTTGQDDDFDIAEMSAMLSESLGAMRQAVKDGTVTKKEVAELEVSLGCSLKEVITMTEAAVKMSRGAPELESMVSLFKQLQVIKNK